MFISCLKLHSVGWQHPPHMLLSRDLHPEVPQDQCCTCAMVAVGGHIRGVLAIADAIKPEARGVVAALAQLGHVCHMVTGDNWRVARAISAQLGIINVSAECLPAAKAAKIRVRASLKQRGAVQQLDAWWRGCMTIGH